VIKKRNALCQPWFSSVEENKNKFPKTYYYCGRLI
jgi:hypothetical protein